MKSKLVYALGLSLLTTISLSAATTNALVGDWSGTLDTGIAKLRLVFRITNAPNGALTATLDSIDQGARGIPVDTVSVSNKTLRMEVKAVKGLYVGTLDADQVKASGLWSQGAAVLALSLEKGQGTTTEAEPFSPEEAAANKLAATKLAGTWNGALVTGVASLRLRVNISKSAAAGAVGTMDSLDQGANGIPLSAITLKGNRVRFEARGVGGVYEGTLGTNGAALSGEWEQGGQALPLNFEKAASK